MVPLGLGPPWYWVASALVLIGLAGWVTNSNYLGLHRMYHDRLMETFLPDLETIPGNQWRRADQANRAGIDSMCRKNRRPYHLVDTNIVLPNSLQSKYRGRNGDSFVLSPLFCGSDATQWVPSSEFMPKGFEARGRETEAEGRSRMTLATAMAISGAAVNPNAGVGGRGATTDRVVSTLMGLLGLRLGYWAPNPGHKPTHRQPNLLVPGLKGGVLTTGLDEKSSWIQLSDGGHFENLGVYELVRRRCDTILVSDGGCDPSFQFADLANMVERCRVDFGVKIDFDDGQGGASRHPLKDLLPGSAVGVSREMKEKFGLAERGFAVGRIEYPPQPGESERKRATLIYVKTTMRKHLPPDLLGFRGANPDFPDQPTSDQFFDEVQLESYRELGYSLAKEMCRENETRGWL